jgi:hypothetical protein
VTKSKKDYLYCPICRGKHEAVVEYCPHCVVKLVPLLELPPAQEQDYKYCPKCGAEYDTTSDMCMDCFVPLVAPRSGVHRDHPLDKRPGETLLHAAASREEAWTVAEQLQKEGIQDVRIEVLNDDSLDVLYAKSEGYAYAILVPATQAERAKYILSSTPQRSDPAGSDDNDLVSDLVSRLKAAIEAEEEGLPSLVEFFIETKEFRLRAMKAAVEFEEGITFLVEWVKKSCRREELQPLQLEAVADACRILGREEPEWALVELGRELMTGDAYARKNFCYAIGMLGIKKTIPYLVAELRDPDMEVRNEAMDQLYSFEHTDYGFDPDLEPEDQPGALARWQKIASQIR